MTTGRQLIKSALRKIASIQANEEPSASDMDVALETLNALIDSKSTQLLNIHTIKPYQFVLTPSQYQYSLGPSGDWVIPRPMRVEKAKLLMNPEFLNFSASNTSGIFPLTTTFTPSYVVTGDYLWTFGDGNTSTEIVATNEYSNVGVYSVTLSIDGNVEVSKADYITVTTPDIDFTGVPSSGFIPLTVQFTSTGA